MLRPVHKRLLWVGLSGAIFGFLVALGIVVLADLPEVERLEGYRPKSVTKLLDVHGQTLHEFYRERRIPLSYEKIPPLVRKAFLAAEDARFYEHFGIDLKGLFRAIIRNIYKGRYAQGASTITQQLSKNLFLTSEKTLRRKFREALLALQIERHYSKNEILALYLNQIYLGAGCYGIEAAAQTYFEKSVKDLEVHEIALLAGLPKAPNRYQPFRHPERASLRRRTILRLMNENRFITEAQMIEAMEASLPEDDGRRRGQTYFSAHVLGELVQELEEKDIYEGQYVVQTTFDRELQKTAEKAVENAVTAYAKRHRIALDDKVKLPQAALIALDVQTGEIRAMVGGRDYQESQFNRAIQAYRQPGSSFKPIVYLTALERGYTQSTLVEDEPISFYLPNQHEPWEPSNYDEKYDGTIPLRIALEKSKNVVAVRVLQKIGISSLRKIATRIGINSPIAPNLSSALGSSVLTMAELARAYATFANGGIRTNLNAIRMVYNEAGVNVWPSPLPSRPSLDPRLSYIMTDMLSGVIRFGTGRFASDLPCAVAGKTGTTNDYIDSVFAGYSTEIVAVAWVGFDDQRSLGFGETGARAAGHLWREFMQHACKTGKDDFDAPNGIYMVNVDHSSGKLPSPYTSDIVAEAFLPGTEPKEISSEETIPRL